MTISGYWRIDWQGIVYGNRLSRVLSDSVELTDSEAIIAHMVPYTCGKNDSRRGWRKQRRTRFVPVRIPRAYWDTNAIVIPDTPTL